VEILEILSPDIAFDEEIRERARTSSKSLCTKHYIVHENEKEVAFLSLDLRPDIEALVVYELFVPRKMRHRGIGTRVMKETERLARSMGFRKLLLNPKPFEGDYSKAELVNWYRQQGFTERSDFPTQLEKLI
jgi:GNAT superfamily N-acetyltransferase